MKKVLGNVVFIMILISLSGCTLVNRTSSDSTEAVKSTSAMAQNTDEQISAAKPETSTEEPQTSAAESQTPAEESQTSAAETETSSEETTEAETTEAFSEVIFETTDDYVYSMVSLNVRTGPGKSYPVAGCLEKGEKVCRTGIGNNGWYRIVYDNEIRYASGNLMTAQYSEPETDARTAQGDDGVYTAVDETVYPTIILNVRTGPGTGYRKVGGFEKGEAVHRVAVGNNGWSKVEFRGGIYYASSQYLSESKVQAEETAASEEGTEGGSSGKKRDVSGEKIQVTGRWSGNNIRLDWSACDGVDRYIIYRRADWQKYEVDELASGSGQAFTDTTAVSDAEYFADKGVLNTDTEYYEYYICVKHQNGDIQELGRCRVYMDR
ncbi:MAG: SH3 domain-containing protein [Lachnospiraceae bacterium]|nr:SH3 domain-containing protein [Lachnospiraceae bacterium]